MSQSSLFKFLLVGLPVGLAVTIVIALVLYVTKPGRNQPSPDDSRRFAAPIAEVDLVDAVARLSNVVGARSVAMEPDALTRARKFVQSSLGPDNMGYVVSLYPRLIGGVDCPSVIAELPGRGLANEVIVVAAPYTSAPASPGAGRSGSGVAALLSIAKALTGTEQQRTVRFVAYAAETADPASHDLSQAVRVGENESIIVVLDLDTIAFPLRESGVWEVMVPMIVHATDLALAGDIASRHARGTGLRFTVEAVAAPQTQSSKFALPRLTLVAEAGESPAGTASDTADAYDYGRFTQAVKKLRALVERLANPGGV